jgi:hypothetical protein
MSLADLPELVGFFSYSREDDEDSHGGLSRLGQRIHGELATQLGRSRGEFRLWQDKTAIPHGTLWENEIKSAIAQSAFFVPIITPRAVRSHHCVFEFDAFLQRETELGRNDLVFPILYVPIPALASEQHRKQDRVLKIIRARQYADWTELRLEDSSSPQVGRQVARFCRDIVKALEKPWVSPEERKREEEADARRRAEEQRLQREAEAKRQAKEEQRRKEVEAEAQRQAEEQRRKQAEAEAKRQAEERRRLEAEAERLRVEEQRRKEAEAEARL